MCAFFLFLFIHEASQIRIFRHNLRMRMEPFSFPLSLEYCFEWKEWHKSSTTFPLNGYNAWAIPHCHKTLVISTEEGINRRYFNFFSHGIHDGYPTNVSRQSRKSCCYRNNHGFDFAHTFRNHSNPSKRLRSIYPLSVGLTKLLYIGRVDNVVSFTFTFHHH